GHRVRGHRRPVRRDHHQGRSGRAAQFQRLPHAAHQRSAGDRGASRVERRSAGRRGRARDVVRDAGGGERDLRRHGKADPQAPGQGPAARGELSVQRFVAARWGYVAVVLLATLTQLHPSPDLTAAGARLARAFTPSLGWRDAIDGLRNTVLFAGLGAVWVVTSPSGAVRAEIRRATLVGLALSATVEGLQVFSPVRTASIVDVTTNTLGALVGAGAVALLIAAVVAAKGARSYLGVPSFLVAGAYGAAVLCETLTPLFGPAALPWTAGGPVGRLNAGLAAAGPISFDSLPL